jgi:1-acyl-sn-glycerol-3-phosphate acyltransferase
VTLYDTVAAGMWAYSRAAFRITVLGPERLCIAPGTLLLVTHRRETDVPVLCPPLYRRGELRRQRVAFAARDDLFLPGFFAGFPPGLPVRVRRALFPVGIGRWLPRVEVFPIRSASLARLGEVVRERRAEPLEDVLGPADAAAFVARAAACGLAPPARAADALRGEYADLLWRSVGPDDPAGAGLDGFWGRRAAQAAAAFRTLVELVRGGRPLVLFPEGRPSPDGEIGPLQRGLGALVRRARPPALLPVALAYDPLTRGRTHVVLAFGAPVTPPAADVEGEALGLLRRTMPLTAGQLVAAGAPESAVREAIVEGRPVEPALVPAAARRRRLAEAEQGARTAPDALPYLAREFESARAVEDRR